MSTLKSAGELRQAITAAKLSWHVDPRYADHDIPPQHPLGCLTAKVPQASSIPKADFQRVLADVPVSPKLAEARARLLRDPKAPGGILKDGGHPRPVTVDWRNRFDAPWLTTIQSQIPCGACWAFAATALVETMVRIEHGIWSKRSEGDVHDGLGMRCADGSWPHRALDWIRTHGLCDPQCYPFTPADSTYSTRPDRVGRSVKIGGYTDLGDVEQQKAWLDAVGPLVACFDVYSDFGGYGSGIYRVTPGATYAGGHCVLVVGYDDSPGAGCWICRNSWGVWGEDGYLRIAYGECNIDGYSKLGLSSTDVDPWTRRRASAGVFLESSGGPAHRDFELLATEAGTSLRHFTRNNAAMDMPWKAPPAFQLHATVPGATVGASNTMAVPAACPTLFPTTYARSFEGIFPTLDHRLARTVFDAQSRTWKDARLFGPSDVAGTPGVLQRATGALEVVVRTAGGQLQHLSEAHPQLDDWRNGGRFAAGVAASGPALIERHDGQLYVVCTTAAGHMEGWLRQDEWTGWVRESSFGAGITGSPCLIEGQFGAVDELTPGNYELCVAAGGHAEHWWRPNAAGSPWTRTASFGHDVRQVVGLVEGSFNFNLEVIVLRTDNQLQHYWRDASGWHEGAVFGNT